MSYRIEYDFQAFKFPAEETGHPEDLYVVAILGGDNNMYEHDSNRRYRSWSACFFGTYKEIMREACRGAGYIYGGGLQFYGTRYTEEGYIRKFRKLLDNAVEGFKADEYRPRKGYRHVYMGLHLELPENIIAEAQVKCPALLEQLMHRGHGEGTRYGESFKVWKFNTDEVKEFFSYIDIFKLTAAWRCFSVNGTGAS